MNDQPFHPSQLGFTSCDFTSVKRYEWLPDPTRPYILRSGLYAMQAVEGWWEIGYIVNGVDTCMYQLHGDSTLENFHITYKTYVQKHHDERWSHQHHGYRHYESLLSLLNQTIRRNKLHAIGI